MFSFETYIFPLAKLVLNLGELKPIAAYDFNIFLFDTSFNADFEEFF